MRLRPEFEQSRAQLLHSPTAYTLDEAFSILLVEETRLRVSSPAPGDALAAQRFAPPPSTVLPPVRPPPPVISSESSRPQRLKRAVTCYHCGILGHIERDYWKKQCGFPRASSAPSPLTGQPPLLQTLLPSYAPQA